MRTKTIWYPNFLHITPLIFDLEPLAREPLPGDHLRTRAFLKVQDGCDNFCTFCITRVARGKGVSRPLAEVMVDVKSALDGGVKEIVLTGVHLGSWGKDIDHTLHLRDLIETILKETKFSVYDYPHWSPGILGRISSAYGRIPDYVRICIYHCNQAQGLF